MLLGLVAIPTMVLSHGDYNSMMAYCSRNTTNVTYCVPSYDNDSTYDWLMSMHYLNSYNYKQIEKLNNLTEQDSQVDYVILSFVCMIVMFVSNLLILSNTKLLCKEIDYSDITPADYTLMISNIKGDYKDLEDMRKNVLEMVYSLIFKS